MKLYKRCNDVDTCLHCVQLKGYGCFEFTVPYDGVYILKVRMADNCRKNCQCKPTVTLNNIGVKYFSIE